MVLQNCNDNNALKCLIINLIFRAAEDDVQKKIRSAEAAEDDVQKKIRSAEAAEVQKRRQSKRQEEKKIR